MKHNFDLQDAELFKDVCFLVEANNHEQHQLWVDHFYKPRADMPRQIKNWKEVSMGHGITIGQLDKRPIVVSVNYAYLEGKKVMFYYGCSQLVDHKLIEDWLQYFTKKIKWDNDTRWAHCDAMNFHLCMDAVQGR